MIEYQVSVTPEVTTEQLMKTAFQIVDAANSHHFSIFFNKDTLTLRLYDVEENQK